MNRRSSVFPDHSSACIQALTAVSKLPVGTEIRSGAMRVFGIRNHLHAKAIPMRLRKGMRPNRLIFGHKKRAISDLQEQNCPSFLCPQEPAEKGSVFEFIGNLCRPPSRTMSGNVRLKTEISPMETYALVGVSAFPEGALKRILMHRYA